MAPSSKINMCIGLGQALIPTFPVPGIFQRAPTSSDREFPLGFVWINNATSPATIYFYQGAGSWSSETSPTFSSLTVQGTANINTTGSAVTTIGTGGTGAVNIGNTTGGTTITGTENVTGDLNLTSVATKISLNGGAVTDFIGTGTLAAGTVTIANTNIAAGDRIFLQRIAANGSTTLGELSYAITPATNFVVTSLIVGTPASPQTGDTSTFSYIIFRQT